MLSESKPTPLLPWAGWVQFRVSQEVQQGTGGSHSILALGGWGEVSADPDGGEGRGWTGMPGALGKAQRMTVSSPVWTTLLKGSQVSRDLGTSAELARESWDAKH